jgi:hypothetical protein
MARTATESNLGGPPRFYRICNLGGGGGEKNGQYKAVHAARLHGNDRRDIYERHAVPCIGERDGRVPQRLAPCRASALSFTGTLEFSLSAGLRSTPRSVPSNVAGGSGSGASGEHGHPVLQRKASPERVRNSAGSDRRRPSGGCH